MSSRNVPVRGSGFNGAQLNTENPVGTVQSIDHALRALDKNMADESERLARSEKMLSDFQAQLGKRSSVNLTGRT